MRYLLFLVAMALLIACHSSHSDPMEITIVPGSAATDADVRDIIKVRGETPGDHWRVDKSNGDVIIIKSRNDGTIYAPGSSVECWHFDTKTNKWTVRPSA